MTLGECVQGTLRPYPTPYPIPMCKQGFSGAPGVPGTNPRMSCTVCPTGQYTHAIDSAKFRATPAPGFVATSGQSVARRPRRHHPKQVWPTGTSAETRTTPKLGSGNANQHCPHNKGGQPVCNRRDPAASATSMRGVETNVPEC